jgi:2-keto-4-pentenoate hydratase
MQRSGATIALPHDRPVILEIEIAFRLAHDLPPRPGRAYSHAEVSEAVEAVLVGAELIAARGGMPSTGTPFPRFVADLQGNAGYVCGTETRDFRALYEERIDETRLTELSPVVFRAAAQGDVVARGILTRLSSELVMRQAGGLKAGQVITTGSCTPPSRSTSRARCATITRSAKSTWPSCASERAFCSR